MYADNLVLRPAMDLQLFGEGEDPPSEPAEPPQPVQEEEESYESLGDFLNKHMTEEPGEPEPEPLEDPPPQKTDEERAILGKFKSQEELVKAYQEAERRISQQGEENSRAKADLEQLRGQVHQLQQWAQKVQQPKQPEASEEEIKEQSQKWLDKFYENPMEALNEVVEQRVQKEVEPIQQEYQKQKAIQQYSQEVAAARERYPDFDELTPHMEEIVKEQGQYISTLPNAVEVVYGMAKARTAHGSQPQNQDSLLQDQNFREKILQDEGIRNEILKQYAQNVQGKKPPVVLGEQQGEIPASPPEKITNTREAKQASMSLFRKMLGGGSQ